MAKKPNRPFPDDEPIRGNVPPEPADLFEADTDPVPPNAADAQELSEADLFDFGEPPVTEPMPPKTPIVPTADDDDILAWDVLADGSSASVVGKRPADSGSSILGGRGAATAPGSGWLDSGLTLDQPADQTRAFPEGPSASGVNLHDPHGTGDAESESSIFGRGATDQSSRVEIPLPPMTDDATDAVEAVGPASVWDEAFDGGGDRRADDAAATVDWDALKGLGNQMRQVRHDGEEPADDDDQHTMRAPRPDLGGDEAVDWDALKGLGQQVRKLRQEEPEDDAARTMSAPDAAADDFEMWLKAESGTVPPPQPRVPSPDPTAVGLPVGGPRVPTPAPVTTPSRRPAALVGADVDLDEDDDEPVKTAPKRADEKKKGKSGAMGWIGGGIAGLLIGGGGVFGLSQMGVLPGQDTTGKPIASNTQTGGNPADAQKLAALQKAADDAEAARADAVRNLDAAEARAKEGEQAVKDLAAAKASADKAGTALIDATKKQTEAEMKLIAVNKDVEKATLELNSSKEDLKTAMRDLEVAQKRAKAGDDTLAGLVKEFKAAKLIPEDADAIAGLAALPEAAKKAAAGASGDTKKLTDALAAAMKDADGLKANLKAAADDLAKAKADTDKAMKTADDRAKELADAQKKAKAGEDTLAGLVKEFKAAKLIDASADDATALAKLPEAAKKATAAAMSGDGAKAAEALLAAKKELDASQAALKKADTDLTAAKKDAAEAMAAAAAATKAADAAKTEAGKMLATIKTELTKAIEAAKEDGAKAVAVAKKEADDKVKDAVARATADADAKLKAADTAAKAAEAKAVVEAQARAAADAKVKAAADTLTAKEADFARQLAAARAAGGTAGMPAVAVEAVATEKAMTAYSAGVSHYFAGRYADAERELKTAAAGAADARFNYYLGLAQLAQGRTEAAAENFRAGAALERRSRPNASDIGEALERIQGAPRQELAKYRSM